MARVSSASEVTREWDYTRRGVCWTIFLLVMVFDATIWVNWHIYVEVHLHGLMF
jgi:hypothetical protein